MNHVWKCAYCSETESDPELMAQHESICSRNPDVKDCGSCANFTLVPFEHSWTCKFGCDFRDEKTLPCIKWKSKT